MSTMSLPRISLGSSSSAPDRRRRAQVVLSVAGFVLLLIGWWLLGDMTRFLPGIREVLRCFPEFLGRSLGWREVARMTVRVVGSLGIAFVLAGAAALVRLRSRFWCRVPPA